MSNAETTPFSAEELERIAKHLPPGPWIEDEACICAPDGAAAQVCIPDEYFRLEADQMPPEVLLRCQSISRAIAAIPRLIATARANTELEQVRAERDDLAKRVYQPGIWRCAKCNFRLVQSNLHAASGAITTRDKPGDTCPNDGSPMWRVSWQEDASAATQWGEQQFDRAIKAETANAELVESAFIAGSAWRGSQECFPYRWESEAAKAYAQHAIASLQPKKEG